MEIQCMQNIHLVDYGQYSVETFACLNWINLKFSCMDLPAPHWRYRKVWMQENKKWNVDIHSIKVKVSEIILHCHLISNMWKPAVQTEQLAINVWNKLTKLWIKVVVQQIPVTVVVAPVQTDSLASALSHPVSASFVSPSNSQPPPPYCISAPTDLWGFPGTAC